MCLFIDVAFVHSWQIALEKLLNLGPKEIFPSVLCWPVLETNVPCTRPCPPLAPFDVPGEMRVSGLQLRQ